MDKSYDFTTLRSKAIEIGTANPDLIDYIDNITNLASDYDNKSHQDMMLSAISSIFVLSSKNIRKWYHTLNEALITDFQDVKACCVVPVSKSSETDGSNIAARKLAQTNRNRKITIYETFSGFQKEYLKCDGNAPRFERIYFIDDFIGTGRKMEEFIKSKSDLLKKHSNDTVRIASPFSMIDGVEHLESKSYQVVTVKKFQKFSETQNLLDERECHRVLSEMEELLASKSGRYKLSKFHLGYGKCESCFYIEGDNSPNNNLPILWWEKNLNGSNRDVFVQRS